MSFNELIERELKKGRTLKFDYNNYDIIYLKYDEKSNTFYTLSNNPEYVCDKMMQIDLLDYAQDCYQVKFEDRA